MKAPVSKTGIPLWGIAGSNPALSAICSKSGELSREQLTVKVSTAECPARRADFRLIRWSGAESNLIRLNRIPRRYSNIQQRTETNERPPLKPLRVVADQQNANRGRIYNSRKQGAKSRALGYEDHRRGDRRGDAGSCGLVPPVFPAYPGGSTSCSAHDEDPLLAGNYPTSQCSARQSLYVLRSHPQQKQPPN